MIYLFGKRVRVTFNLPNGLDLIPLAYKCGWFEGTVTQAGELSKFFSLTDCIIVTRDDDGSREHFRRIDGRWLFLYGKLDEVPASIIPLTKRPLPIVSGERDLSKLLKRRVVVTFDGQTPLPRSLLRFGRVEGVVVVMALENHGVNHGVSVCVRVETMECLWLSVPVLNGHGTTSMPLFGRHDHDDSCFFTFSVVEERVLLLLDKKFGHLVCRDALGVLMAFLC